MNADYEIVPISFHRPRNAQTAKIYLPEDTVCRSNQQQLCIQYGNSPSRERALWNVVENLQPMKRPKPPTDQDQMLMNLDLELALLPGITTNMLPLERFSSWYTDGLDRASKYESELHRILKTRSYSSYKYNKPEYIQYRYAATRAFNPRSFFHRYKARRARTCLHALSPPLMPRPSQKRWNPA